MTFNRPIIIIIIMAKRKETYELVRLFTQEHMFLHCTEESHQRAEPKVDPIMNLNIREEGKKEVDAYGRLAEERSALSNRIKVTELETQKIML